MPVHVLPDPASYCATRLSSDRRRKVRKGLSELDILVLRAPDILLEQGYGVALEAKMYNLGVSLPGPAEFRQWILSYVAPERGLIVAGLKDGRLLCPWHHHRAHDPAYEAKHLPDGSLRFHRRT